MYSFVHRKSLPDSVNRLILCMVLVGDMRIVYHGHACFEFVDSRISVVIDPHDGKSIGIKAPNASADIVLMTHNHYDHCASRVIRGNHTDVMSQNDDFEVNGFHVTGLSTYHDHNNGEDRGMNTMYIFEMDGLRLCHCGDLGCVPSDDIIEMIRGIDIIFVPVGEVFTMTIQEARSFIERVNPTVVIPMHYRVGGLSIPLSPLDDFLDMIPDEAVEYVGNEIDVIKDDLSEIKECWVFSR